MKFLLLLLLCLLINQSKANAQSCSCTEYLYLNDVGTGEVHKFAVNTDGTITEVGAPWMSGFTNPHGLGSDINGFLYIGDDPTGPIYRVTCDGGTVAANAVQWNTAITGNITNIGSYGGYIFVNGGSSTINSNHIAVLDPCTGDYVGSVCLNGTDNDYNDWGMQILPDGTILATEGLSWGTGDHSIWKFQFDEAMVAPVDDAIANGLCVDPFVDGGYLNNYDNINGITTDGNYLYIVTNSDVAGTVLVKIDANTGAYVSEQADDGANNVGFNGALGIVYAPTSGRLYVSGYEDCIAIVDTANLAYIGPGNGTIPSGSIPKAIAILKECCPNPADLVVDKTLCTPAIGEKFFLQDLLDCDGIVCEGQWQADAGNTGLTYDNCDQTVTISATEACGSFSLGSDGTGNNAQCGVFTITLNIEVLTEAVTTITNDQTVCPGDVPAVLTSSTTGIGITYQWQSSTTSCTDGFTDIAGANSDTYSPTAVSQTTYYQLLTTVTGACSSGVCTAPSNCATIAIDPTCVSYDVSLDKVVNMAETTVGSDVTYTITVTNNGDAVTGTTVNEVLPNGALYVSDDVLGAYDVATGVWTIGAMATGEVAVLNLTITLTEEGVSINSATVSVNETETNMTNNEDDACVSVPIALPCSGNGISAVAESGVASYQWYKDGVVIDGETTDTYLIMSPGSYNYTINGGVLDGSCTDQMCCPIIVLDGDCAACPPTYCLPVTITRSN